MIAVLVAMMPFISMAQEGTKDVNVRTNTAPCYNYWSVGAFGGLTQFHGDLSKELLVNLSPNDIGYTFGLTVTKQFSRVIGVRALVAYGHLHNIVSDKWVWDYQGGNGVPQKISQSFRTSMFESDIQLTVNWLNWVLGPKPG